MYPITRSAFLGAVLRRNVVVELAGKLSQQPYPLANFPASTRYSCPLPTRNSHSRTGGGGNQRRLFNWWSAIAVPFIPT
jgi:hypothetical protein